MMTAEYIIEIENNRYTTIVGLLSVFSIFKKNNDDFEIILARSNNGSYRFLLHVVDQVVKYIEEAENKEFFINHLNKLNTWSEILAKDINLDILSTLYDYFCIPSNRGKIMPDSQWADEISDEYKATINQQDSTQSHICSVVGEKLIKDNSYWAARKLGKLAIRGKDKQ